MTKGIGRATKADKQIEVKSNIFVLDHNKGNITDENRPFMP